MSTDAEYEEACGYVRSGNVRAFRRWVHARRTLEEVCPVLYAEVACYGGRHHRQFFRILQDRGVLLPFYSPAMSAIWAHNDACLRHMLDTMDRAPPAGMVQNLFHHALDKGRACCAGVLASYAYARRVPIDFPERESDDEDEM